MGRKAITIRDVAREAEVSIATVSRVINGHTVPGNKTASKVLKAAQKVGYTIAGLQAENSRRTVLAIIHDTNVEYLDRVLGGIYRASRQLNYDVAIHVIRDRDFEHKDFLKLAKVVSASGIIFVSACVPSSIIRAVEATIPVVKCVDVLEDDDITCVGINDRAAFSTLTSYLISTGRTKIALMRAPLMGNIADYREAGFREVIRQHNLPLRPEWISPLIQRNEGIADYNHVSYYVQTLLSAEERPDAIMCTIDNDAAMVVKAVHRMGFRVPEDVAVTGFYNLHLAQLLHPELTTVETHAVDIGNTAMHMLDERIKNPFLPHARLYTNAEIIVRKST